MEPFHTIVVRPPSPPSIHRRSASSVCCRRSIPRRSTCRRCLSAAPTNSEYAELEMAMEFRVPLSGTFPPPKRNKPHRPSKTRKTSQKTRLFLHQRGLRTVRFVTFRNFPCCSSSSNKILDDGATSNLSKRSVLLGLSRINRFRRRSPVGKYTRHYHSKHSQKFCTFLKLVAECCA